LSYSECDIQNKWFTGKGGAFFELKKGTGSFIPCSELHGKTFHGIKKVLQKNKIMFVAF